MSGGATFSGMTGFGRADGVQGGSSWAVEARSVNGRGLEVRFRGPPGFDSLERLAKAGVQERLSRGQVTISVQAKRASSAAAVRVNDEVLARYVELAQSLMAQGASAPTADGLLALRGVLDAPEDGDEDDARSDIEAALAGAIATALDALREARLAEGAQLRGLIEGFIATINTLLTRAEAEAAAQVDAIHDRFSRRMTELAPDAPGLEERVFLEASALAAKADVREELDRLAAHVASARTLLDQAPAGRKLDFLMQEFMREANTLCSKSATTALTAIGLELKAVIEQMREQVQNVE